MDKRNDNAVSLARVIGMLMIVTCHLFSFCGVTALAQVFNVGVELFLLISGYLYANKKIGNSGHFIKMRWRKLCIPMYLWVIVILPLNLISNKSSLVSILVYAFNIQGLGTLFWKFKTLPTLIGAGHLWFLTVIMICYLLLVPIKYVERKLVCTSRKIVWLSFVLLVVLDIALIFVGIQIGYFICYFLGYVIGKQDGPLKLIKFSFTSIIMVISMGLRIIGKIYMDDTIIYNKGIAVLTHIILALWIFRLVQLLAEKLGTLTVRVSSSKIWKWLEKESFFIYLTHYAFLVGPFCVVGISPNRVFQIAVFVVCTVLSAYALCFVSDSIIGYIPASVSKRH